MPEPIHDRGYKRLFENIHFLQQLLESFVGKAWVKDLDFSQCESIKKSYVSDDYKETTKDLLYKVRFRGKDFYIVILLEFQSTIPYFMVIRVLHYIVSFYLDLTEQKDPPKTLPPVFPIVLYNGQDDWDAPTDINDVIEQGELMQECRIIFRFFLVAINQYTPEKLQEIGNLVSTLFLGDGHYDLDTLKAGFAHLIDTHPDQEDILQLLHWFLMLAVKDRRPMPDYEELQQIIHDKTKVMNMLEKALEADRQEGYKQGLAEGEARGKAEGEARGKAEGEARGEARGKAIGEAKSLAKTAKNMLQLGVSIADIAKYTELTESEILKLQDEMTKH